MIAYLKGTVVGVGPRGHIIDVHGVGYAVHTTLGDSNHLQQTADVELFIYEQIREDAHELYGFLAADTQAMFELLLSVSGVGPKMALNILNIGSWQDVAQTIASEDVKGLTAANGVGKRVAERVVVELKDKVVELGVGASSSVREKGSGISTSDAAAALVGLGYSLADAKGMLAEIDASLTTEEQLKKALSRS